MQSLDKGMSEEMHYLSYKIYLIRFRASFIEKRGEKLNEFFFTKHLLKFFILLFLQELASAFYFQR